MDGSGIEGGARTGTRPRVTAEERREWRKIRSLVLRAGVPKVDADDVTQEVMLAIARSTCFTVPPGATNEEARAAWTCGVVRIQVIRYRSEQARRAAEQALFGTEHGCPEERERVVPSTEEGAILREEVASALGALDRIQEERRAVFVAYQVEEEAMVDVAADMGVPVNTAWNLLRLARGDLRAEVARAGLRAHWSAGW